MATRLLDLLRCDLPIQLAPMGSVSATPALPLAVAAAGGHGMYPGLTLPPPVLAGVIDALTERTTAFGVNFIVPLIDRGSLELAAERAPYVDFFLADPDPALVALVHAGGAVCGWQVESAEEARAAEAAGCDVVIAKAWESGGRKRIEGPTLLPLLDAVLDGVSLPVIAAGGIATRRGAAAALAAGAHGVRVGTRFIAAAESDAHPAWIDALIGAGRRTPSSARRSTWDYRFPDRTGCCAPRSRRPRRSPTASRRVWFGWRERRSPSRGSHHSRPRASRPARSRRCPSTPASRRAP